ncbi:hypothetical protein H0E87_020715, partial [Populus deltoides]
MLDPLLVEVDLDLLLLLRCWSSLPLDLSVGQLCWEPVGDAGSAAGGGGSGSMAAERE